MAVIPVLVTGINRGAVLVWIPVTSTGMTAPLQSSKVKTYVRHHQTDADAP